MEFLVKYLVKGILQSLYRERVSTSILFSFMFPSLIMVFPKHVGVDTSFYFHMMLVLKIFFTKKEKVLTILLDNKKYMMIEFLIKV